MKTLESEIYVYEVFRREKEGAPMMHAGNVTATSDDLALIYAREVFGRRGESVALWVVRRAALLLLDDAEILRPVFERSHRNPDGYRVREKLQAAQAKIGAATERSHG